MTAAPDTDPAHDVIGLLGTFVRTTPGVDHAVVVSSDGLLIGASADLGRDDGDHLAAIVSGFTGLATSASRRFGYHGLRLVMVEMGGGFLVITAVSDGSRLGALLAQDADVGQVGYELSVLATRCGELPAPVRALVDASAPPAADHDA